EAGFQIMPTAEEAAAAANGDPITAPVSAPVVTDLSLQAGDPVLAGGGPEFDGFLDSMPR
ncbi:MAG: hypothetical protein KDD82_26740, partial [Planctomycetes bacterium]|nr:hypothetical protein [Planctomycetota bacterium]